MAIRTSYSQARENFASLWDEVESSREPAVIQRRGHEDMALLPADELSSLRESKRMVSFERSPFTEKRAALADCPRPRS